MATNMGNAFDELMDLICNYQAPPAQMGATAYDAKSMDIFLNSVLDKLESLKTEAVNLEAALQAERERQMAQPTQVIHPVVPEKAEAPATEAVPSEDFKEILLMAQRVKSETISKAKADAEGIIASAQAEADAMLGGLTEQKEKLESTIARLKTSAAETKQKIQALLDDQKRLLDSAEDI